MSHTLLIERSLHSARIVLNRPDVCNAFDDAVIAELTQAFQTLGDDDNMRAIVLAASGPVFCAGADLHWMQQMAGYTKAENLADAARLAHMLHTIATCPKPVVAQVQGDCLGGGIGLVAACDIALAADSARFCFSEVRLGLIPATISPYVIRAIGARAAQRYFLTAERFSAQAAQRIGLLHEVVSAEALDASVDVIVHHLLANGPQAVRQAKQLVRDVDGRALDDALIDDTIDRIAAIRISDEGREGIAACLEKRPPKW